MKLEQTEASFIFQSIQLPDVFFTEYLSEAPGDYIKVYLYCLFLSKYNKEIKINDLSKKISVPIKTIQDALTFWENGDLITKKGNDYMPIISIFKALTLAEIMAPERGTKYASNIRLLFNQYIIQQ